jgi:hypothetical protein
MRKILTAVILLPAFSLADAPGSDSDWTVTMADDPSGYGEVAVLYKDAGNTIKDEYATKDVIPRLSFSCSPGDSSVTASIDWQRFISSFSTEVGFKVDDGRFTWLKWKLDSSEKVTTSPSADDSGRLLAMMGAGETLKVEISPYSEGPVEVEYPLAGFADALETLKGRCE